MFSLPVLGWIMGDGYLQRGMSVGILVQAAAVLVILYNAWGFRRTAATFFIVAGLTYFTELLGVMTGIPFGKYHYSAVLQPQLADVPVLIPLAWMMMLPPAWAVGRLITRKSGRSPAFVLVSALAFTGTNPSRCATRWTCVSTGSAGRPSANISTHAAVFGPTPLNFINQARVQLCRLL